MTPLGSTSMTKGKRPYEEEYDNNNPVISFRLSTQLKEELEEILKSRNIKKAQFFRMVVRDFVSGEIDVRMDREGRLYIDKMK